MSLTVGSLFSGIGGLELGLERAGFEVKFQVEIEPYAQKVLAKHWPNTPRFGDVRTVGKHNLPRVDLLCGGFPCQDISVAGKGAGLAGARSGLWREYLRIIQEIQPSWVLIENVPALRSRGLGTVLGDLASSGFDAEWDGFSASAFGAPHQRDRIFIVAYSQRISLRLQQGGSGGPGGHGKTIFGLDGNSGHVANTDRERELQQGGPVSEVGGRSCDGRLPSTNAWAVEPDVGRVAHGVSSRVDRLKCLGNAVVPQIAEYVGRRILGAL